MFKGKSGSFFQKEQDRIEELIKDQLLQLVLQYLPHLQLTKSEQDDVWEIVAIEMTNIMISEKFDNLDDIPTLSGMFMKQIFDKCMKNFTHKYQDIGFMMSEDMIRNRIKDRTEFILFEIYKLRNFDLQVMSKLSQERFEQHQRDSFDNKADKVYDPSKLLKQFQVNHENIKLEIFEKELDKRSKKIDQLAEENKRLLELNHELLKNES